MGDLSEMRGLIVVISFIGVFVTIVALMVSESPSLFTSLPSNGTSTIPTANNKLPSEFLAWNTTYTHNLTGSPGTEKFFDLAGWHYVVEEKINIYSQHWIGMATFDYFWIFPNPWSFDFFKFYHEGDLIADRYLHIYSLDALYAANKTLKFECINSKTSASVLFQFKETTYTDPQDAYDAGALTMHFNIDWEDRNTSVNVLNFIGALFMWNLPGLDWRIQALMMIPLMVASAYMLFIFVLRIVGSVFGGGGA